MSADDSTLCAKGSLHAALDRYCVVTGQLFTFEFETDFSTYVKELGGSVPLYGSGSGLGSRFTDAEEGEGEFDEDLYDDEIEAGTAMDVGEIVAQYLYLNMPPYVAMPGKSLEDIPDQVTFELGADGGIDEQPEAPRQPRRPSW